MAADKPIGPGDMVVVVRDCCRLYIGHIFTVDRVAPLAAGVDEIYCGFCKYTLPGSIQVAINRDYIPRHSLIAQLPVDWLKRLDPDLLADEPPIEKELPCPSPS